MNVRFIHTCLACYLSLRLRQDTVQTLTVELGDTGMDSKFNLALIVLKCALGCEVPLV